MEKDIEKNFEKYNENCVEWLSGGRTCTCTFTNRKHINRIKKLYENHKDDFGFLYEIRMEVFAVRFR